MLTEIFKNFSYLFHYLFQCLIMKLFKYFSLKSLIACSDNKCEILHKATRTQSLGGCPAGFSPAAVPRTPPEDEESCKKEQVRTLTHGALKTNCYQAPQPQLNKCASRRCLKSTWRQTGSQCMHCTLHRDCVNIIKWLSLSALHVAV